MSNWIFPSQYPSSYDDFSANQVDNVDVVYANHPNALASAISKVQQKLGVTNSPIVGVGGLQFFSAGKSANPGLVGHPTVWVDNSTVGGFAIKYTDELGGTYDLRQATSAGFLGFNYSCSSLGLRQLASVSTSNTLIPADATAGRRAAGVVIALRSGDTLCDIAYRSEVVGFTDMVPGATYYLGDAGELVLEGDIPATASIKQEIGVARSATVLIVDPSLVTLVE